MSQKTIQTHIIKKPSRTSISNRQVAIMSVPSLHPSSSPSCLKISSCRHSERNQLELFGSVRGMTSNRMSFCPQHFTPSVYQGVGFRVVIFIEKRLSCVDDYSDDVFFESDVFCSNCKSISIKINSTIQHLVSENHLEYLNLH